jgi:uncharacterized Zn-finger protein
VAFSWWTAYFHLRRARVRVQGRYGERPQDARKRTHSGERPFACDAPGCEFRAAASGNLVTHKRTHTGERPFACDEPGCEYRATRSGKLKAHKRTHSGEQP